MARAGAVLHPVGFGIKLLRREKHQLDIMRQAGLRRPSPEIAGKPAQFRGLPGFQLVHGAIS
jgi:hypothetical protein